MGTRVLQRKTCVSYQRQIPALRIYQYFSFGYFVWGQLPQLNTTLPFWNHVSKGNSALNISEALETNHSIFRQKGFLSSILECLLHF